MAEDKRTGHDENWDQSAAERDNDNVGLGASAEEMGLSKPEDPKAVPTNEPTAPHNDVFPLAEPPEDESEDETDEGAADE